jgi:hypothetical protein
MGDSAVTRLVGIDWGAESRVTHCVSDVLPMTLDLLAAGVDPDFIGRAQDRCGFTVRHAVSPEFVTAAVPVLTEMLTDGGTR